MSLENSILYSTSSSHLSQVDYRSLEEEEHLILTAPPNWMKRVPKSNSGTARSRIRKSTNGFSILMTIFIKMYQSLISSQDVPGCRYYPSCSHFAVQVIERYGPAKGLLLSIDRISRCNPLVKKGYTWDPKRQRYLDPVEKYNFSNNNR
jgi:hypothetical protein